MTDLALRPSTIEYTECALERMEQMSVCGEEVEAALAEPEVDRPSKEHPERRLATKGRLVVVYQPRPHRCHLVITTHRANPDDRSTEPSTRVPAHPSNREFLEMLALWGCTPGRKRGDALQIRAPNGTLFEVRPPLYSHSSASMIRDAYAALGVSAEQFWSRETKVRLPRERVHVARRPRPAARTTPTTKPVVRSFKGGVAPAKADAVERLIAFRDGKTMPVARVRPQPRRPRHGQILDWFKLRPGSTYDAATIADGVDLDIQRVRVACARLCRDGLLQRVTRGHYRLSVIDESDTDRRLTEINAELATTEDLLRRADLIQERIELLHLHRPEVVDDILDDLDDFDVEVPAPTEAPVETPVLVDYEEEIDSLLALIAPEGVQGQHAVAVARWREATRNLFDHLHES